MSVSEFEFARAQALAAEHSHGQPLKFFHPLHPSNLIKDSSRPHSDMHTRTAVSALNLQGI